MKNKKLFAILTLVCFMLTLMPVAAFAADATNNTVANSNSVAYVSEDTTSLDVSCVHEGKTVSDSAKGNL